MASLVCRPIQMQLYCQLRFLLCGKIWLSLFLHGMDCDTAHSAGKKKNKNSVVMNGGIAF